MVSNEPAELDSAADDSFSHIVTPEQAGKRLDALLASLLTDFSRVQLRKLVANGDVELDGKQVKPALRVSAGQRVFLRLPEQVAEGPEPEDIPLNILYEDDALAVVNKPPGMVVHPAKGHWSGTLTAALAFHFESLSQVGGAVRPGIVHRLDRDTSGVIVIAKTDQAHLRLASQFEQRTVEKHYTAIVSGVPDRDRDMIDQPIGPHPHQREKMAIRTDHPGSRTAQSFYEVLERFRGFAVVDIAPKTGRTHQIRIHLAHIGCPVLCDRLYGGRTRITVQDLDRRSHDDQVLLGRQALHATTLRLRHPLTDEEHTWEAPLPDDMAVTIETLRRLR